MRWSVDFVHDQFALGFPTPWNVTRECLAAIHDTSITGKWVATTEYFETNLPDRRLVIPKLRNHNSCYPALCRDGRIVNVGQIKHLDGRYKPAATSQMGRG